VPGSLIAGALPDDVLHQLEGKMLRYRRTTPISFLEKVFGTRDGAALRMSLRASSYSQFYEVRGKEVLQNFVAPALHSTKFLQKPVFANNILHNFRPGQPLLYPTFADGNSIPEHLIVGIDNVARRYTLEIQWRDNDVLMFDNTRFMHGRRAIVDPQRTLWTQFSDVDF
jgi:Taurine catabolism dioxygenase TauD, TfdA family